MRLYLHGYLGADYDTLLHPIVDDGHEVHVLDPSMSALEIYNELMEADAVLLQYNDDDAERGTVLGLALAFGKQVYVVSTQGPGTNAFLGLEGVMVYDDLYDVLPDVRAALNEVKDDAEEHSRLDGPGGNTDDGRGDPGAP